MVADWRVGAGADLERAPLSPVRVLDAREFPEFVGGGPDVQFPRLALELDQSGVTGIVAGLDRHVHHGLIVAAAVMRDKPGLLTGCPRHEHPRVITTDSMHWSWAATGLRSRSHAGPDNDPLL